MTPDGARARPSRRLAPEVLLARLAAAVDQAFPGAEVRELRQVSGGASSLTYSAVLTGVGTSPRACFVKVAPAGLEPVRNRDVVRQAALQALLAEDGRIPVPEILLVDAGDPPDSPPLYVSGAVEGESLEPLVDREPAFPAADVLTGRTLAAGAVLARLHEVDVEWVAGLPAAGPAGVDLGGEVDRWARVFSTVDPELAEVGEQCAERLRRQLPEALAPAVVHGDFRLGNLICAGAAVRAVLDWEIWSITDPRIDLAWFLMTLAHDGLPSAVRTAAPGLPGPAVALAEYERARGAVMPDMAWFGSLSRFRAAAAMALNVKHNRRRPEPDPAIERYAETLVPFLRAGVALLEDDVHVARSRVI
ncbi:phosphotransferase family protein [Pseudonocardia oroxyli]|uniref:Predicted kinase, aminoglycoside phosphotransferase (APT) family n=1 Tax=Pseudonocardia oroxyli TaxID=366584 RepID=A0A1G7TNV0_PSEOR|nr:phosphotransferase family protein [Pseudonocardia oroxyli]SDG37007.1 Predicted kinase, aminoglycoside phosphotransferase (APT) family [Pseudonocardia oroxyli]